MKVKKKIPRKNPKKLQEHHILQAVMICNNAVIAVTADTIVRVADIAMTGADTIAKAAVIVMTGADTIAKVADTVTTEMADIIAKAAVIAMTEMADLTEIIRAVVSADRMAAGTLTNVPLRRRCLFQENRLQ